MILSALRYFVLLNYFFNSKRDGGQPVRNEVGQLLFRQQRADNAQQGGVRVHRLTIRFVLFENFVRPANALKFEKLY